LQRHLTIPRDGVRKFRTHPKRLTSRHVGRVTSSPSPPLRHQRPLPPVPQRPLAPRFCCARCPGPRRQPEASRILTWPTLGKMKMSSHQLCLPRPRALCLNAAFPSNTTLCTIACTRPQTMEPTALDSPIKRRKTLASAAGPGKLMLAAASDASRRLSTPSLFNRRKAPSGQQRAAGSRELLCLHHTGSSSHPLPLPFPSPLPQPPFLRPCPPRHVHPKAQHRRQAR
jgi:hypothetical protein